MPEIYVASYRDGAYALTDAVKWPIALPGRLCQSAQRNYGSSGVMSLLAANAKGELVDEAVVGTIKNRVLQLVKPSESSALRVQQGLSASDRSRKTGKGE